MPDPTTTTPPPSGDGPAAQAAPPRRRRPTTADDSWPQIQFKIDPALRDALQIAAEDRMIATGVLLNLAVSEMLARLVPVEELQLLRPR